MFTPAHLRFVVLTFLLASALSGLGVAPAHAQTDTNGPPVATNDNAETLQETRVVVDVLANDTDPDGDPLQVSSVSLPSNGKVAIVDAGIEYTPEPGFTGEDTFTYVAADGRGGTDEATVLVTVTARTGTLAGTVFDNATEARIVGAQVQIPTLNRGATTDSQGNYSFGNVPIGTYDVTATAVGYRSSTRSVVVNTDQTTTSNFFLRVDDGLVRWTGGGDGTSWSDPGNWETGSVPTIEDVAIIDLNPEATFSVVVDADVAVGGLRLETVWATLQVDNRLDVTGALGLAAGTVSGPDSLVTGGTVAFSGGQVAGAGTVVMDGGLRWTGGSMRGSGQTIVNGASTLNTEQGFQADGRPLYERTLTFTDTVTVEQGFLDTRQGALVVVGPEAVVQFPDDRTGIRPLEYTSPRPRLENRGLIVKTGRGTSFYTSNLGYQEDTYRGDQSITIVNTGVIRSENGTLSVYVAEDTDVGGIVETTASGRMNFYRARFSSDAQLGFSATVRGDGVFNFADAYRFTGTFDLAGTALLTGGQRFDESMTLRRAGTLRLRTYRDGVFTFAAPNTPAIDTFLVRGLMEQQSDFDVMGRFGFGSEGAATLTGSGTITVGPDGEMLWGPGRLGGAGTVDVQGRLTAVVATYLAGDFRVQESEKWLDGRTMIVRGPATWDDATLNFDNGGFLDLREASVFDLQRDAVFQPGELAVGEEGMRLAGQFVKSGNGRRTSTGSELVAYDDGFYDATVGVPTQNEGTLSIEAGTVALQNAMLTNTGLVQGTDTLDVSESNSIFDNQGTVGPGPASGRFTVVGAFDNSAATLAIELAGTAAGETYDQLVVQGPATLGGVLDVTVVDPFDPPGDSEYVILRAESLTGTFDTVNLPTLDGRAVELETTETDVRVRVLQTVTNSDPVAENDAAETTAGTSVLVDVLANDSDPDNDPLTISNVGPPELGTAQIEEGGIRYSPPASFTGEVTFSYEVSDGRGGVAQANVQVSVLAGNTPPVAENDAAATDANTAIVVDVLANDRDSDGDPLSVAEVRAPSNGTAVLVDGGIEYTPADGFSGEDSFSYVVSDGRGGTDEASVIVSVGQPNGTPVATTDSAETEANTSVVVEVLANDRDPDGDALTVTDVGTPSNGEVRIESDGTVVRYSPAQDFEGEDVFSYTVSDGQGGTADATVTITVLPVNGAPVAEADSASTEQGTAVRIAVLVNDTDPDGDSLRVSAVGSPESGTAQIEGDVIVYTPDAGFVGTDAFLYTIADEREATDEASVTVRVDRPNTPPVALDDAAMTVRETPVIIPVMANDTDEDGDPLTVTITAEPVTGTAARQDDQTVRYVPASGFTGTDIFRYRVEDGRGGSDEAVVTVTVEGLRFTVTSLGTLGGDASRAVAINDEGDVVGLSRTGDGTVQGFRWRNGIMMPLVPVGFRPFALSDDGTAAGHVERDSTIEAALSARDGSLTRLGTLGGRNSVAYAINATGDVVGTAQLSDGEYRAFRWTGSMTSLGAFGGEHSEAFALNRAGVAAGTVVREGRHRAWMGSGLLEGNGESRVYDLNEAGLAVGSALMNETVVARLWRGETAEDLGTGEGAWAEAYAVNDAGWVVGTTTETIGATAAARQRKSTMASRYATAWRTSPAASLRRGLQLGAEMAKQAVVNSEDLRAFLWIDGEIRDLNDFIPPDDGWTLLEARHLNNRGQIVGTGLLDGEERAFLLTPTDNAPPTADPDQEVVASGRDHVIRVLDNDSDQDGDRLRLVSVSSPQLGRVEVASDSSALLYRSDARVQGTDAFSYVVSDGAGTTARGTVKLDVQIYVDPNSSPLLEPSAPNPVRNRTRIRYLLPKAGPVRLEVFDVLGRRRAVLVDERQEAGAKDVWLDVRRWAAGTYFCRLQAGDSVQTHAMTVVR